MDLHKGICLTLGALDVGITGLCPTSGQRLKATNLVASPLSPESSRHGQSNAKGLGSLAGSPQSIGAILAASRGPFVRRTFSTAVPHGKRFCLFGVGCRNVT